MVALAVEKGSLLDLSGRAKRGYASLVGPGFAEVGEFRERYLGGRLLAAEEVVAWVEEQARREGAARARLRPRAARSRRPAGLRRARPGGLQRRPTSPGSSAAPAASARAARWSCPSAQPRERRRRSSTGPRERPQMVRIRSDGALARLKVVVTNLLAHFDGWLEEQAVAFVLAGEVPPLDKLRARTRRGLYTAASRITLDCDPRTAPSEVAAFYERLRQRWLKGRDRLMNPKGLALAVFTEQQWQPESSWPELRRLWNAEHPVRR